MKVSYHPRWRAEGADGLATLAEHLLKTRRYTCIKWLSITNEPGRDWSWWQGPSGPDERRGGTSVVQAYILIQTEESRLKLSATNLEIGISCWIPARIVDQLFTPVMYTAAVVAVVGVVLVALSYSVRHAPAAAPARCFGVRTPVVRGAGPRFGISARSPRARPLHCDRWPRRACVPRAALIRDRRSAGPSSLRS